MTRDSDLPELDPNLGDWDETAMGRRRFLEKSFWAVTGVAVLSAGSAGTRFMVGNSLDSKPEKWVEIGKLTELDPSRVNRVNFSVRATDAWREVQRTGTLYVFSDDGGATYTVLDASCTHLGCVVKWNEDDNRYVCPCHQGYFSRDGAVLAGPPPRPLRELPTRVETDVLWAAILG